MSGPFVHLPFLCWKSTPQLETGHKSGIPFVLKTPEFGAPRPGGDSDVGLGSQDADHFIRAPPLQDLVVGMVQGHYPHVADPLLADT